MEWYKKNNVKFVPKTENPPNCPELRAIEKYWTIIKRKMKKTKKLCRNIKDIKISFKKASNSFDSYSVRKCLWVPLKKKLEILLDSHRNNNFFFLMFNLLILLY